MENKKIYELRLHETLIIQNEDNHITILRVPGGWIYTIRLVLKAKVKNEDGTMEMIKQLFSTSTFIPLSGEFNK